MKRVLISLSVPVLILVSGLYSVSLDAGQSTFLTAPVTKPALDVPYVPTPQDVVDEMLKLAGVNSNDTLIDLGCGDGRTVVAAAKDRNVRKAIGVDIDPQRIKESNENARKAGVTDRVTFYQKNLFELDLKEASVMTLYLLPSINLKLRPKLLRDLKPGTRIVSHDFDMGDWTPDKKLGYSGHTIYYWVVPANVNGDWNWSSSDGKKTHRYELRLGQSFQILRTAELREDNIDKALRNITFIGDKLEFSIEGEIKGMEGPARFIGIVKGDQIEGTIASLKGSEKKWTARRDPETATPLESTIVVYPVQAGTH